MGYREQQVPGPLMRWVECTWTRTGPDGEGGFARIVPDGCMDLLWSDRTGLVAVGPNTSGFLSPLAAGGSAVGVRLHPGAGSPLFGVAAPALRDGRMPAAKLWGGAGARLDERVRDASGAGERGALMLEWLAARARRADEPDPIVRAFATRLGRLPQARIGGLARELAVSERHLRRLVIEEVGYGPKRLGRVLRLRRALASVRAGMPLAEVAYESGYADQAHFTSDCQALAGTTPLAFRQSRLTLAVSSKARRGRAAQP